MDVELMLGFRRCRSYHRSAWKPVARQRETGLSSRCLSVSAGKLAGIKDGPGLMRQHQIRDLTTEPVREDTAADAE